MILSLQASGPKHVNAGPQQECGLPLLKHTADCDKIDLFEAQGFGLQESRLREIDTSTLGLRASRSLPFFKTRVRAVSGSPRATTLAASFAIWHQAFKPLIRVSCHHLDWRGLCRKYQAANCRDLIHTVGRIQRQSSSVVVADRTTKPQAENPQNIP